MAASSSRNDVARGGLSPTRVAMTVIVSPGHARTASSSRQVPAVALAQPSVPRNAMMEPSMPPGDYPSSPFGDYERRRQLQEKRAQIIKVIRGK
jgi:hypothetical protein